MRRKLAGANNQLAWLVSNTVGDYAEAVRCSVRSLELRPDSPGYLDTLGHCYYAVGNFAEAVQAQQQAVSDGWATCVQFDAAADTWTTYRGACGTGGDKLAGPVDLGDERLDLTDVAFSPAEGGGTTGVTFSARGTASPGSLKIARDGSDHVLTVAVEGLTGRVTTR